MAWSLPPRGEGLVVGRGVGHVEHQTVDGHHSQAVTHAPRVPARAIGTAIRSNKSFNGASPSRVPACDRALVEGTVQEVNS